MMYLGNQAVGMATSLPVFSDIAQIEMGSYTPTEDELVSGKTFNHGLGTIPDFIILTGTNLNYSGNSWAKKYIIMSSASKVMINQLAAMNDYYMALEIDTSTTSTSITSATMTVYRTSFATDSSFKIVIRQASANEIYFQANATYTYIIGKFKEVTSNANE